MKRRRRRISLCCGLFVKPMKSFKKYHKPLTRMHFSVTLFFSRLSQFRLCQIGRLGLISQNIFAPEFGISKFLGGTKSARPHNFTKKQAMTHDFTRRFYSVLGKISRGCNLGPKEFFSENIFFLCSAGLSTPPSALSLQVLWRLAFKSLRIRFAFRSLRVRFQTKFILFR